MFFFIIHVSANATIIFSDGFFHPYTNMHDLKPDQTILDHPNQTKPNSIKPNQTKRDETQKNLTIPKLTKFNQTKHNQTKPNQTKQIKL